MGSSDESPSNERVELKRKRSSKWSTPPQNQLKLTRARSQIEKAQMHGSNPFTTYPLKPAPSSRLA